MESTLKAIDFRFFIGGACLVPGDNKPILATIESINSDLDTVMVKGVGYHPILVKPILRKFDMLSRHEIEGLNKLWPSENIKRTINDSIVLDANIINYLTALSVDVFDWISKGIAVDAEYNSISSK